MSPPVPASPQPPARVALPSSPDAQFVGKRNSSRKLGFVFILLLLFLMFITFAVALWLD